MPDAPLSRSVQLASRQQQFLNVISRDEAIERFQAHLKMAPLGEETVSLDAAQGRVLSRNVAAAIDVPGFDRSNVDGFAVRSADTAGAMEESPRRLRLNDEVLVPGAVPQLEVQPGTATPIATGGMVPRGADAVLMIEHSELVESGTSNVEVRRVSVEAGRVSVEEESPAMYPSPLSLGRGAGGEGSISPLSLGRGAGGEGCLRGPALGALDPSSGLRPPSPPGEGPKSAPPGEGPKSAPPGEGPKSARQGEAADSCDSPALLEVSRSVAPGEGISFAGTDIARGETALWAGQLVTSREIGVMAALGMTAVSVYRKPRVAVISTGDEIVPPGQPLPAGHVYDSNAAILSAAVRELGGEPVLCGTFPDDEPGLNQAVDNALDCDVVLLSGGTSKGAGDLSYRVVSRFHDPGIVAHGVALKPGKPICLAVTQGKPVVVLPGFPTSAIFTFHEFVAPVIRALAGMPQCSPLSLGRGAGGEGRLRGPALGACDPSSGLRPPSPQGEGFKAAPQGEGLLQTMPGKSVPDTPSVRETVSTTGKSTVSAKLAMRLHSDRGRTEYALVRLFRSKRGLYAYPMGKGSGSVTTFSHADGFLTIPQQREMLEADEPVEVTLLDPSLRAPDLVVIGSHCIGLDLLIGKLRRRGFSATVMAVGSQGGLAAARREECDVAGIHLFDPQSGEYNKPFVPETCRLISGYTRKQCLVFRPGDPRFTGSSDVPSALKDVIHDPKCVMVNRNPGSGTRILIDRLLAELASTVERVSPVDQRSTINDQRPAGYGVQVKSHNAVAAAVSQGRADWGIAIETVARQYGLAMVPWLDEHYDFVVPLSRADSPAVKAFEQLLLDPQIQTALAAMKLFVASRDRSS